METGFQRKINFSGHEGQGVHVCHKCGWPFPNPHPSAKHRRAHKRICGTIEGYKLGDSGENKTHLDASDDEHQSDDESKNPSNGLKTVEKTAEMTITRRSSSGAGSGSSRSTRSEEDMFSDAVTEFDDFPGVAGSVDVVRPASVMPDTSEDDGVTQLAVESAVADAGDLYPRNNANGTQLQTVECFRPENELVEIDMPSQHHLSSSALDSISTSGLDTRREESSVGESMLQCSEIAVFLDSQEKGIVEAAQDKKSEDIASILTQNAGETSEAVSLPQKVHGDGLEFVPADDAMEVVAKQGDGIDDKHDCFPKVDFVGQTNSSEKGGVEAAPDNKSEDIASVPNENAGELSEVSLPQKVNGDSLEFLLADAAVEVIAKQGDGYDDKNDCSPEVNLAGPTNNSENEGVEKDLDEKSDGIASIPTENAGKTSVFIPQEVNGDNLEFKSTCAAMEVIGEQGYGFDAKDECSRKSDFVGKINRLEDSSQATEDANVEAGSSPEIFEGHGSCNDSVHVVVVSDDDLPLREHSKVVLEDHKTEKLPAAITIDPDQEVKGVEHGKDYTFTSISSAEPGESPNRNFEDIVSEAHHKEDDFAEEVSVENKMEQTETQATAADTSRLCSIVHPDKDGNEVGQGKAVTSTEEQNPVIIVDTNLQSVLDDGDNQTQSIRGLLHDGSEHDSEEAEFSDALEAETTKVAEEELSLTSETFSASDNYVTSEKNLLGGGDDKSDYDARSREVQENLSESAPSVPQPNDHMVDKAGIERNYDLASESRNASLLKCDIETKKLQDSEVAVQDLDSFSEPMVGGECASAVGASSIPSIGNNVDLTEQTHNDENCVHKASDSVIVSLFNNVRDNDAVLVNSEVSKGAKEPENFGENLSVGVGSVDLGLISDNDESIDLTQNTANGVNVGAHEEAVSAVEQSFTKERDGRASGFTDGDRNLVKQEEAVPELDTQADSSSQTDSLECNWGSVSVLSAFSDAPAATDTGSQPSQASLKVEKASLQPKSNNGKTDIFEPPSFLSLVEEKTDGGDQNEGASEAQPSKKPQDRAGWFPSLSSGANESSGRKKNKEVIEKVANWSTEKQHMPLKSYLGESSPSAKDNPHLGTQKTERTMMDSKGPIDEAAMGEMRKEWNSPARYPDNIKRERGKVRSRPYWAPFICCSSVQTS